MKGTCELCDRNEIELAIRLNTVLVLKDDEALKKH